MMNRREWKRRKWLKYRQCDRKQMYHNEKSAAANGQTVYWCRWCGGWHRCGPIPMAKRAGDPLNRVLPQDFELKPQSHHKPSNQGTHTGDTP
jgi:hypothetical protein